MCLPVLAENLADKFLLASDYVHLGGIEQIVSVVVVDLNIANEDGILHVLVHGKLVVIRNSVGHVRLAAVVSIGVPAS